MQSYFLRQRTAALWAVLLTAATLTAQAETWTDVTGKYQIEAQFVAVKGQQVYLKRADGSTIAVNLAQLSPASRQLAAKLAAAPAPKPAPAPGLPAAAVGGDDPVAHFRAIIEQANAGNSDVLWQALPASYQRDVNSVVHEFAAKMDTQLWNASVSLLAKVGAVLESKQSFIATSLKQVPQLADVPQLQDENVLKQGIGGMGLVLTTIAKSDLANLDKLKTADAGNLLKSSTAQLSEATKQLQALANNQAGPGADPTLTKIELVSRNGDTAVLRFTPPPAAKKGPQEIPMVKVEGKWVPKPMVDQWAMGVQQARQWIATSMQEDLQKASVGVMMVQQMATPLLDQMLQANTQAEFDKVIGQIMQMGKMFGGGAAGPGGGGGAADPFGN